MLTKISKEFDWEMSHRLPFHDGLCRNIHGHTYKLRIDLVGEPDSNGMLVDFYTMEKIMLPIIDRLDHAFLVNEQDTKVLAFLKENGFKHEVIPYYSTSENIIKYIADRAIPEFSKIGRISGISVRLHETPDAFAEITVNM